MSPFILRDASLASPAERDGGWRACCAPLPATQSPPPPGRPAARNLLIITIDTLRADRLGAYGDGEASTPAIDALAHRGVLFRRAFAPTPITLPSHASLMTGRYPAGHGARHNGMRLDLAVPTLADRLATAGFATGAFIAPSRSIAASG